MKKTDSPDRRLRLYEILASVLIFAILIGWALALNLTAGDRELTAAQKRMFAVAEVTDVLADNASPDTWTEGRRIGQQLLEVKVLTGEHKGAVLEAANFLSAYANVDAKVGTKVIVRLDVDEQGELYVVSVPAYNRAPVMLGLALIFAALLVIIGRKKGVMALVGLVYTLACIWFIQVPMILRGAEPVLVSIIIVALTTAASLLFLTGLSRKTLCGGLGFHFSAERLQPPRGRGPRPPRHAGYREDKRAAGQRHTCRFPWRGHGCGHVHFIFLLGAPSAEPRAAQGCSIPLRYEHWPRRNGHDGEHANSGIRGRFPQHAAAVSDIRLPGHPAIQLRRNSCGAHTRLSGLDRHHTDCAARRSAERGSHAPGKGTASKTEIASACRPQRGWQQARRCPCQERSPESLCFQGFPGFAYISRAAIHSCARCRRGWRSRVG